MRREGIYIVLLLLTTCFAGSKAQHHSEVELSLEMDQFQILSKGENIFVVEARDQQYYYSENPSYPALPLRSVAVLVPNGAELLNFSFSSTDSLIKEGILLEQVVLPVPSSLPLVNQVNSEIFRASFPNELVTYSSTMVQRGYTWFSFTFSPFRYNGKSGELSLVKKLKLDVSYSLNEKHTSVVRPDRAVIRSLNERMLNPGDLELYYPRDEISQSKSSTEQIDYLIITTGELADGFKPLLEWKARKGLKTGITTLDEISEIYDDATIQLKIKRYLYDRYVDGGLKWVLLGGDHDLIPVQACYSIIVNGSTTIEDASLPTDLFYSCFDNRFDWNATIDEKIGQVYKDDNDLVPDIYLSRIPVRNMEHVKVFVEKTLNYEKQHPTKDFDEKILMVGVKTWASWAGKSDSHHRSELMFSNHVARYWNGEMVRFFDTGTDFNGDNTYQVTASNLSAQLNSGFGYFHFSGHGDNRTLKMESGSRFDINDALELSNPVSGIVLANSCDVNAFDSIDPCLSEAFLRNPNGGAMAVFGSSRYGFGLPGESNKLGPSFQYNATFLKNLFSETPDSKWKSFAGVAAVTKAEFAHNGSSGGTYLYLLYAINPVGDPEVPLFTRDPSVFNKIRVYRLGDKLTVNMGGLEECRICLTSLDLGEGFQQVVENVSHHTFEGIPGAFQLTVTAPNYQPYIYRSGLLSGMVDDLKSSVRIYPNPVKEFLNIDSQLSEGRIQIYNSGGKLMTGQAIIQGVNKISMESFTDGVYLLNVTSESANAWFKVLKY